MNVLENKIDHLNDFVKLNEEWISSYFELESVDFELAKNPRKIIDDGGYVFTIEVDSEVLGACALFNSGSGEYELARMAVSPKSQGKGFGNELMLASLKKAKEIGAKKITIVSNTTLSAAIALYKKHGFQVVSLGQHPIYSRANIVMAISTS